jgi:hypothetical protein
MMALDPQSDAGAFFSPAPLHEVLAHAALKKAEDRWDAAAALLAAGYSILSAKLGPDIAAVSAVETLEEMRSRLIHQETSKAHVLHPHANGGQGA